MTALRWVAGVDGCRGGWAVVSWPISDPSPPTLTVMATFAEVLAYAQTAACIAVDMPIGLPERSGIGGRSCDRLARARLGDRQSSVFAVPARLVIAETDYARACVVALTRSEPPRKVSKQCFNLFPKIRELDALLEPSMQKRVVECHPELAFWAMNGQQPLTLPKRIKSRPYGPGLDQRRRLLAAQGFVVSEDWFAGSTFGCHPDDALDASACAWTARRKAEGRAIRLPPEPACDARGLRMEIWA
jgi:predicted RNase H-like nuclease